MKVGITGVCGYLGNITARKLLENGNQVIGLDNFTYGKEAVMDLFGKKYDYNFELIKGDIRNLLDVKKLFDREVDGVIHLAGIVGEEASMVDQKQSSLTNLIANENMAYMAELYDVSLIFASSASVYGSREAEMITETSKTSPIGIYAKHKYRSERVILNGHHAPCIFRFGTLFGYSPRMRFDLVVNKFIAQALNNEKITVHGGEQIRPFLHVQDASDALIFALEYNLDGVYNVISENNSILDVARIIGVETGGEIDVKRGEIDPRNYKISIGKLFGLGWKPQYGVSFACKEIATKFGDNFAYTDKKYSNLETLKSI